MSEDMNLQSMNAMPAHRALKPADSSPRLGGFNNLFSKELGDWFHSRRWIRQLILWVGIINVSTAFIMLAAASDAAQAAEEMPSTLEMGAQMIFAMMVIGGSIGAIIMAQDEVIGEKTSGTAAWVLSKPVSRSALILAKLLANTIGILVFVIGIPAVIGYFEVWAAAGTALPVAPYIAATGTAALGPLFYMSLAIMLGVLFDRRGPVLGISLAVLLGGSALLNMLPALATALPLALQNISAALVLGVPLPAVMLVEIPVTVVWIILFVVIAVLRFEKVEF